jgi:hypothetical protein
MSSIEWTCPFCNRHATITAHNQKTNYCTINADNFDKTKVLKGIYTRCPNEKCHQYTLEVTAGDYQDLTHGYRISNGKTWQLIPESNAKPFPDYIPEQLRADYTEACLVKDKSPKASATLSRRCLQGIIRDFHGIKKKNLSKAITALQGKIEPVVWKAIDAVRKMGNIAAHMEKDVNLIIEVVPEEAALLLGLIVRLFEEWYVARHERDIEMKSIIELAEEKEKIRKSNKKTDLPGDWQSPNDVKKE